jgi:hypothetical protein
MATLLDSKATLDTLPTELALAILNYIPLSSLHSLNLVNWHFHMLTLGHVYATFPGHKALQFLRTIALSPSIERSNLAKRVKNIVWTQNYLESCKEEISKSDTLAIIQTYRELALTSPNRGQGDLDAMLPTLISDRSRAVQVEHWFFDFFLLFMPNVEWLEVHDAWLWDDHTYWFTNVAANATQFTRLKTIIIHGPLRIENIIPLLAMPSLRDLELWKVAILRQALGEVFPWDQPDRHILEEASSGLKRLALRQSYIDSDLLLPLLSAIRALESFTYEHQYVNLNYPSNQTRVVDFPSLAAALSKHGSTLETLRIHKPSTLFLNDLILLLAGTPVLKHLDVKMCAYSDGIVSFSGHSESDVEEHIIRLWPTTLQTLKVDFGFDQGISLLFLQFSIQKWFIESFARVLKRRGFKQICFVYGDAIGDYVKEWEMLRHGFEDAGIEFLLEKQTDWYE